MVKTFLCVLILISCKALFAEASSFQGVVLETFPENNTLRVQGSIEGAEPLTVRVSNGDIQIDYTGKVVRGNLNEEDGALWLRQIFPNNSDKLIQMNQANRQLRRDTVTRGRKVFRGEGEYLPQFALFNQFGEVVTPQEFVGKYVVMNFIFTRCTVVTMCPAGTTRMSELQELVAEKGLADKVQFVTITFDPSHDSPGILKMYADAYGIEHQNYHFLTGEQQPINDLTRQFGITTKEEDGTINHSMATVLVDRKGRIVYWRPGSRWTTKDFVNRITALEKDD